MSEETICRVCGSTFYTHELRDGICDECRPNPETKRGGMSFDAWVNKFEELCVALHPSNAGYGIKNADSWRDYYDDGYTPNEALADDRTYWE